MSGEFALPLSLLRTIPERICNGAMSDQLAQGFLNLPFFVWWAFSLVRGSSGLAPGVEGVAIVAAYRIADVLELILRKGWR